MQDSNLTNDCLGGGDNSLLSEQDCSRVRGEEVLSLPLSFAGGNRVLERPVIEHYSHLQL